MLRIADTIVELIREMRPAAEAIGRRDADLARGAPARAVERRPERGGGERIARARRPSHYSIALGSAQEALMAIRTAEAWGYIAPLPPATSDAFGKVIATLVKVSRA